jgi:excisionase family DNA binding protein
MATPATKKTAKRQQQYNRITRGPNRATLAPRETVEITGISERTTYRMLHRGEIPHIRVGSRYLIPRVALMNWLASAAGSQPDNAD